MAINSVLYSSESEVWETPKDLFDKLDTEFHFDIMAGRLGHGCVKPWNQRQQ